MAVSMYQTTQITPGVSFAHLLLTPIQIKLKSFKSTHKGVNQRSKSATQVQQRPKSPCVC